MIYELRTYSFPPGKMPAYLKLAEEVGSKIRGDDYGKREGSWVAEFGMLNQVWHLWSYPDLNERQRLRAELAKNDAWMREFVAEIRPLLAKQELRFLQSVRPMKPPADRGNVYELRIYRTKVGEARTFAGLLSDMLPVRERYSQNVGIWLTEAPQPNEVCHLWVYGDLNQRHDARAKLMADPDWLAFLPKAGPMLEEMHSTVLLPTAFSPMG